MEQVIIDKEKCTGCGVCVTICSYQAIVLADETAEYIQKDCFLCGANYQAAAEYLASGKFVFTGLLQVRPKSVENARNKNPLRALSRNRASKFPSGKTHQYGSSAFRLGSP